MKTTIYLIAITLGVMLLVETGARAILWAPAAENPAGHIRIGVNARTLGDHHPNQDGIATFEFLEWPYHVETNADGFRNNVPVRSGPVRIVALGDSFTYGAFVDTHDTWANWLEHYLNRDAGTDRVQILNNGVSGTSIVDQADYLEQKGGDIDADLLILATTVNDVPEAGPTFRTFGYVRRHGIQVEHDLQFGDLRAFLGQNVATYGLARHLKDMFIRSERGTFQDGSSQVPRPDDAARADMTYLAANGTGYLTPTRRAVADALGFPAENFDLYAAEFGRFRAAADARGVATLVVFLPTHMELSALPHAGFHRDFIREVTRDAGVPFIDLTDALSRFDFETVLNVRDRDATGAYISEGHYSRFGHIQTARALIEPVRRALERLSNTAARAIDPAANGTP